VVDDAAQNSLENIVAQRHLPQMFVASQGVLSGVLPNGPATGTLDMGRIARVHHQAQPVPKG
jgi:hypothetical protein